MSRIRIIPLPAHTASSRSGTLVPVEFASAVPFAVARAYFIFGVRSRGVVRGAHAHLQEDECFICLRGRVAARISEDGNPPQNIILRQPDEMLYVPKLVWHEFTDFSPDAMLLAFSNVPYTPGNQNYITDFSAFRALVQPGTAS